jgi:thioredoxin-like negative regulator of GroEL
VSTARIAELLGDLQLDTRGATRLAEALYRESLERDPGRASAEAGLATVLARQGRVGPARELVEAAVATEPDSLPIRLALGEVQALAARASDPPDPVRMEEARATLRALVQRYPDRIAPSVALGVSFVDVAGDPSEGIAALERVGAEAPALVPGLPLAKLYLAAGRHGDARTQLRTVVRWSAGEPAEEARKLLEELERAEPGPDRDGGEDTLRSPPGSDG